MSRSGYSDDCDGWALIRWRGAVASSIRGKRGQAFMRDLVAALDAMPEKRLIAGDLKVEEVNPVLRYLFAPWPREPFEHGRRDYYFASTWPAIELPQVAGVCALGALGVRRGLDVEGLDPEDSESVAMMFDIADPLAREVVFMNDEGWYGSPEERWRHMRRWAASNIKGDPPSGGE